MSESLQEWLDRATKSVEKVFWEELEKIEGENK